MDDDQWTRECNTYMVRKQLLRILTLACFSIAYFDAMIGGTGVAIVSMRIKRTDSWYPYVIPAFQNPDAGSQANELRQQLIKIGPELGLLSLLISAAFLFFGAWKKRIWLIHWWFVPNFLLVASIPPIAITFACLEQPPYYSLIFATMALRIFAVTVVYLFKSTLTFKEEEDARLRQRYSRANRINEETQM